MGHQIRKDDLMKIEREKWLQRSMLRTNPDKLYVFGDNAKRVGLGGQAKACRGKPNAHGIATLCAPHKPFSESDGHEPIAIMERDRVALQTRTKKTGATFVWPVDGVGTGLARMPQKLRQTLDGMIMDLFGVENDLRRV
jgi:hypothetical protein